MCLAASTSSVASVATGITASEQTFQISGSPVTVAGQVLAAKLPLPANSKIVALNMPTSPGGREHERHPSPAGLCVHFPEWMEKSCERQKYSLEEVETQRMGAASVSCFHCPILLWMWFTRAHTETHRHTDTHQRFISLIKQSFLSTGVVQQKVFGIFPSGPPANLRTYSTLHPTTGNINLRASASAAQQQVFCRSAFFFQLH